MLKTVGTVESNYLDTRCCYGEIIDCIGREDDTLIFVHRYIAGDKLLSEHSCSRPLSSFNLIGIKKVELRKEPKY
jgi:hypothetical protein